jgi:integrase
MAQAQSEGTKSVYGAGVTHYRNYLKYIQHPRLPRIHHSERFLMFVVYLAKVRKLSYGTIKVYTAGVRDWFVQSGRKVSSASNGHNTPQMRLLLRGIKRDQHARRKRARHPLTLDKLEKVLQAIPHLDISLAGKIRLKTALLMAFWGFLRSSEYCTNGVPALRHRDIELRKLSNGTSYISLTLQKTKTSQFAPVRSTYILTQPHVAQSKR